MKGIIKETFYLVHATQGEADNGDYDDAELAFSKGDEVEILKSYESDEWFGGGAYVIFNEKTQEAMTIAKALVDVVEVAND